MNINIALMFILRVLSLLISLMYFPLLLKYIDRTDYGILITLTSLIGWIGMLDIGLGNGLRNKLAVAISTNDFLTARKYVSSTYAAIALYIGGFLIIFLSTSHFFSWSSILNAPPEQDIQLLQLVNILVLLFGINFLLGLLNSILFAYQLPYIQSVFTFVAQIIGFVAVYVAITYFGITSILTIGIITSIISPIVLLVGSIVLYANKFKLIRPSFSLIKLSAAKEIVSLGFKFFMLQIITIVIYQANNIIIAHVVNPEAVVEYNIATRYLDVLVVIFTIIVTPVWSATTEAFAKKDYEWIKRTVKRLNLIAIGVFGGGIIMLIASRPVFTIWLGEGVLEINHSTLALVLLFVTFKMLYQAYAFVINGIGKVKAQMIITAIMALCYVPFAILAGQKFGLSGVILVSAFSQVVNFVWSRYQYQKLINLQAAGIWNQ